MRGTLNIFLILNCTLICIYFGKGVAAEQGPIVETKFGKVEGYLTENTRVFKGIPFGGSVSGPNRWKDAEFPVAWRPDILNATNDPPPCAQMCFGTSCLHQSEDCLFLNVYTPLNATDCTNYPVLIFIHGGAFLIGSSTTPIYDGSYLASSSEIVVVSIQYRLGALGFLVYGPSDGDPTIGGNFGIKDQTLAFQWVQDNIQAFGGSKDDVTISGQSAGAMSVAIHMTSENHTDLFHKAIIESDPFGLNYRTVDEAKELGNEFSHILGCTTVQCMRTKDIKDIIAAQKQVIPIPPGLAAPVFPWAPVVDGDLLTKQPLENFRSGQVVKMPTVMGTTNDEGVMFVYMVAQALGLSGPIPKTLYKVFIFLMFGMNVDHYLTVYALYPSPGTPGYDHGLLLSEIVTDYAFYCPTVLAAQSSSSVKNPVYSYIFDEPWNVTMGIPAVDKMCATHSCHGAELPYVFHIIGSLETPEEKQLAGTVSKYWGTFVKNGDPNSPEDRDEQCPTVVQTTHWPSNPNQDHFIDLKMIAPNPEVVYDDRKDKCLVLNKIGYGLNPLEALYKAVSTILQPVATPQG